MITTQTQTISSKPSAGSNIAIAFPYRFDEEEDLTVIRVSSSGTRTTLTEGTDYSVSGVGESNGGTVTIFTVNSDDTIVVERIVDITQEQDYVENDAFPAQSHELALDKGTQIDQQLQASIDRAIKVNSGEPNPVVSSQEDRKDTFLAFDSDGNYTEYTGAQVLSKLPLPSGTDLTTGSAFWADDAARGAKAPDFVGQLGVQLDTNRVYVSTGVTAGDWTGADSEYEVIHNRTELDTAIAAGKTDFMIVGDVTITSNLTIPAGKVAVAGDGKFTISTGKLTFNATPTGWGNEQQVFYGNGVNNTTLARAYNSATAGDVEGTFGSVFRIPEWFGATKNLQSFDNTDAITSAFKACPWFESSGTYTNTYTRVLFLKGTYYHLRTIDLLGLNFECIGQGKSISILEAPLTGSPTFDFTNSPVQVADHPQTKWHDIGVTASSSTITCLGHDFKDGDTVWIQTTGTALPDVFSSQTTYYVRDVEYTNNTFSLAATSGGAAITLTSDVGTITSDEAHQVRRKILFHSQILFGGVAGRNTGGTNAADQGSFNNYFKFLHFKFNGDGYNTANVCAPHWVQENTEFENCRFAGGSVAQLQLGLRDRTQYDWFTSNGVIIDQCELAGRLYKTASPGSQDGTGANNAHIGSQINCLGGRFVDISNCTVLGKTGASSSGTFTVAGATCTDVAHGLRNGEPLYITTTGAMSGLEDNVIYYVIRSLDDTFSLSSRINDPNYIVTDTGSTGTLTWTTPNTLPAVIDSASQVLRVRDTHMENCVIGILIRDSLTGATGTGKLSTWPTTPLGPHVMLENIDFTSNIQEAGVKIGYDATFASVHVRNFFAQYNIGLPGGTAPVLLWDAPRDRKSKGYGATSKRRIISYIRGYANEDTSPDGVPQGIYVETPHVELKEPPVFSDPEQFVGQPYVDSGGAVKISLGANPALQSIISNSWSSETGSELVNNNTTDAPNYDLVAVGTARYGDEADAPTNTGAYLGDDAGPNLLNDTDHFTVAAGTRLGYGDVTAANETFGTSFSFTVWCKIPTLATAGSNNTIFSKSGSGVVAATAFTVNVDDTTLDSVGHPFLDGHVVYLTANDSSQLDTTSPYVILNAAANSFNLATYEAPAVALTGLDGSSGTAALISGFEMLWSGDNSEMNFSLKHPAAEFVNYRGNPAVDPVADEWTFYYGDYNALDHTVTLWNVTGNSKKTTLAEDRDADFKAFKPLVDDNIPLYIGTRKNDGVSDGNCCVDELTFYDRVLTDVEVQWLHNWGNGRAYSEHT